MQENVRRIIKIAQLLLRDETGERNAIIDLQFARQLLKMAEQWPFSGDRQRCVRISLQKTCKSSERNGKTLFLDQTASLHKSPFAPPIAGREIAFAKREFVKRNPGSLDLDFLFVATQISDGVAQRFRANQNQFHRVEHLARGLSICRLVHVNQHIGPMKGNNRWIFPRAN
jgi:hypothetical protein